MRTAVLFGASGLVGGHLLTRLLASPRYGQVVSVGRRALGRTDAKLTELVADLGDLAPLGDRLRGEDVYVALGTTIKKAGSQAAFRKVDFDYVVEAARATAALGAERLALVSSLGADAGSMIFYNRVKGETEDAVRPLRFGAIHIFQPSLLLGERSEHRSGERLASALMRGVGKVLVGPLEKYRGIPGDTVAAAMIRVCGEDRVGVHVYPSDEIARLGEGA